MLDEVYPIHELLYSLQLRFHYRFRPLRLLCLAYICDFLRYLSNAFFYVLPTRTACSETSKVQPMRIQAGFGETGLSIHP